MRVCGRTESTKGSRSRLSITYGAESIIYSRGRVCGQVIGYQVGSPDAFNRQLLNPNNIDTDGVSITWLGILHYHIWSFVVGLTENISLFRESNCPCSFTSGHHRSPSYIGSNYYCESGNPTDSFENSQIFSDDPVWDGHKYDGTC